MKYLNLSAVLLLLLVWGLSVASEASEPGASSSAPLSGFLTEYCTECHGAKKQKADINFLAYGSNPRVVEDRKTWEKVHEMLSTREMPPKKKPQPSEGDRSRILDYIVAELAKFDCTGPVDPGRVTLRRLNRTEYNNTIRDLVGVDFNPAGDFPSDEVGYGFDNIGDVLALPPLLMEKYLTAAEQVASAAIDLDYPPKPRVLQIPGERIRPEGEGDHIRTIPGLGLGLYREGQGSARFRSPKDGKYIVRVRSYGDQAGPEPPKLAVRLDNQDLDIIPVGATEDKPQVYELTAHIPDGRHRLAVAYLNNYNNSDNPDRKLRGDRNLFVNWIEVVGPIDEALPPPSVSHARIFVCDPAHEHSAACARRIIAHFARRAYRRPVTDAEVERLLQFLDVVRQEKGNFNEGIQLAVQAILVSPHFLFRWELDPEPDQPQSVRLLNNHELASRLSYFLWSSMPDQELFSLAEQGLLSKPDVLQAQIRRLLHDPKSEAVIKNFAGQWLQIRNLDITTPDPDLFPAFNDELREAMRQETEFFFQSILREDRSVLDLIDADYTFLNQRLAEHYGIAGVEGDEFRKVSLDKSTHRGGILTQGSILTITSNPTRTSPVSRGKWILEQILGTPPPPPPPNVPELNESKEAASTASLRERFELHRAKAECATCHEKMDPLGFALENFDAIGAWRERDGNFPIDPSGKLPTGESIQGVADLKKILKSRDSFVRSLSEKMLTYALGRGLEYYDKCAVDDIYAALVRDHHRFSTLVTAIATSEPFLKKKIGQAPLAAQQQTH